MDSRNQLRDAIDRALYKGHRTPAKVRDWILSAYPDRASGWTKGGMVFDGVAFDWETLKGMVRRRLARVDPPVPKSAEVMTVEVTPRLMHGRFLTRKEAARFLRLKPGTLANMASQSRGPRPATCPGASKALYAISELHRWVEQGDKPWGEDSD